ncbi:MAG TPA: carbonic anhydrase [Acidimicrobiales bacterium]|jgi:carbonic anhydrase|nr:carbonic anhydrase [Acidimicrobiales bacterium]
MELPTILDANRAYQSRGFAVADRTPRPARQLVILTCMDARLDLFRALGLEVGHAHILRNAGGRASDDAIRSLVVSSNLLGTREFGVIHHTNCGLGDTTDADVAGRIADALGHDAPDIPYLAFGDIDDSVRADVDTIASCDALPPGSTVWGGVYDVDDGSLRIVVEPREVGGTAA